MSKKPVAFMSYVHQDDHDNRLSKFRELLGNEVRLQLGEEFPIFQDRNDIAWGQNWQERIKESLDAATFLIPILTPSFFKSSYCRDEVENFLERERKLKRNDLILPVYYVTSPVLDDETKREGDKLAKILATRQSVDWRELRHEPHTSPDFTKALARLAQQIITALEREPKASRPRKSSPASQGTSKKRGKQRPARPSDAPQEKGKPSQSSAKTEPPTLIVDQLHRGDYTTISEAITNAKPGTRILVRPGFYQEGLIIDKPLEIIGSGDLGEIVVQAQGQDAVMFKSTFGRITNLTLRQAGGGDWYGVDITQGRLDLEECDISSQSLACVAIHGNADPRIRRNRIHDGVSGGIYVYETGRGTLEDNEIFSTFLSGVAIKSGGDPTLRRNRIRDCKESGVFVYENGRGTLEDNDIFANAFSGVVIESGSEPTLRRNRITSNQQVAIQVDGGGGTIEDNDLRGNAQGAWLITPDSKPKLKQARNQE